MADSKPGRRYVETGFDKFLKFFSIFFTFYSIFIAGWACNLGIHKLENQQGYFAKASWFLYPLWYWSAFLFAIWISHRFKDAWVSFFDKKHGIIYQGKKRGADPQANADLEKVVETWRWILMLVGLVLGSGIVWFFGYVPLSNIPDKFDRIGIDTSSIDLKINKQDLDGGAILLPVNSLDKQDGKSDSKIIKGTLQIVGHAEKAVTMVWMDSNDFMSLKSEKKQYVRWFMIQKDKNDIIKDTQPRYPLDFETYGLITNDSSRKPEFRSFNLFAQVQEIAIFVVGISALWSLCINIILFFCFDRTKIHKKYNLAMSLDYQSPFKEFGLEHWNNVFNDMYLIAAIGLFVPIISRADFIKGTAGVGIQDAMDVCIVVFVFAPLLAEIFLRRIKVREAFSAMKKKETKENSQKFMDQTLWPFDRDYAGKIGFLAVLFEVSYLLTGMWGNIFGIF